MRLKSAASFFDRDTVYDAYTGKKLFKAQFSSYEGAQPDGSFSQRRTVSLAAGIQFPPRSTVRVQNTTWILGVPMQDTFFDEPVRQSCSAKLAKDLFYIVSPGKAALRDYSTAAQAFGASVYLRSTTNSITNAELDPFYTVSFSSAEIIPAGFFLKSATKNLHIRNTQLLLDGFIGAGCDDISSQSATIQNCDVDISIANAVDPITETSAGSLVSTGIIVDMYKVYSYMSKSDRLTQPGDMSLIVANTVQVNSGSVITVANQKWLSVGVTPYYDAWNVHIRRI